MKSCQNLDYYINQLKFSESLNLRNLYKNTFVSKEEINALSLPIRKSALEIAEGLRVPIKSNALDRIKLKLTPYLIAPISLIGDGEVQWIILIAPTQSGKTVFLQVAVADAIDQDPGTCLYIFPDENNGKAALKEKIIGMIEENPFLLKHVIGPHKTCLSVTKIELDNMTIWPAWAGSLGTLSSKPAKIIIYDEIRLMKLTIGKESNALKLGDDRVTTYSKFGQARVYGVSSPAYKGDLLYKQTKVLGTVILKWMFKCQNCDKFFVPNFYKHVKWEGDIKNAFIICPFCKIKQEEGEFKFKLNVSGKYGIRKEHHGQREIPNIKELKERRMLFWYDSLASPFRSIADIALEYITTKPEIANYRNFVQCWLAIFWEEDVSKISKRKLEDRKRKGYRRGKVPIETKFLTAGVDAQDVGFYTTIYAWGNNKECTLVDHFLIECHKDNTTWSKTREILNNRLNNRLWEGWLVAAWGIDIADGDRTNEIREATSNMERCFNIIGAPDKQVVNIKYFKDLNYYKVKKSIYLEETDIIAVSDNFFIPEDVEQDFLTQFPNARKIKDTNKKTGENIFTWVKVGQNDYRMATVYAFECLDFMIGDFTLRDQLEVSNFIYNPAIMYSVSESGDLSVIKDMQDKGYSEIEDTNNDWYDKIL